MKETRHRRHLPFYVGVVAGLAAAAGMAWFDRALAIETGANVFFLVFLVMTARMIPRLTPAFLKDNAAGEDEPVWVIFLVTLGAVTIAVGSLFALINRQPTPGYLELGLSLASVTLGWLTIHTMTAIHYAHRYWRPERSKEAAPHQGLDFPGDDEPGGTDFLYFSFVVGMTAQTSDVAITSTGMRKLNLLHSVVSFFFNTVLVAAAVNLAVSIGR